jgi:hypothetical protein
MKTLLYIGLTLWSAIALWGNLKDQAVMDGKQRQKVLDTAKTLSELPPIAFVEIISPFSLETPLQGATVTPVTGIPKTKQGILELIASTLKPTGFIRKGTHEILFLPQGQLKVGETFTAKLGGQSYSVQFTQMTDQGFTLQLEEVVFESKFGSLNAKALHFD